MRAAFFILLFPLFLFPSAQAVPAQQPTPAEFRYFSLIHGPIRSAVLYQVHLSPEVLRRCAEECRDLRVFERDNREVPFVILDDRWTEGKGLAYHLEITGYEESGDTAVISMKMPDKYGPVDRLVLETRNRDFRKAAAVYGSDDMKTWDLLAEDAVYDFSSQVDLRKTEIRFREASYRYYRLRLTDAGRKEGKEETVKLRYNGLDFSVNRSSGGRLRIDRVEGRTAPVTERTGVFDEAIFTEFSSSGDRDGNTVIVLEAGLPLERLYFHATTPFFYRMVRVYYSDSGKDGSYVFLTSGPIYRFSISGNKEERHSLEFKSAGHRFYRFIVENGGNAPLGIQKIGFSWIRKNLFFVGLSDAEDYTFCVGNPFIRKKEYDLAHFITRDNWQGSLYEYASLSPLRENDRYMPLPLKDRREKMEKNILTAIVCLLVAGIGYWLYVLLKKAEKNKGE